MAPWPHCATQSESLEQQLLPVVPALVADVPVVLVAPVVVPALVPTVSPVEPVPTLVLPLLLPPVDTAVVPLVLVPVIPVVPAFVVDALPAVVPAFVVVDVFVPVVVVEVLVDVE